MNDDDDVLSRLQHHMALSQILGAPVRNIPAKAVAVIELILPYLTKHTTPREAGIVMASVYAYVAALLLRDSDGDSDMAKQRMHELLEAALTIVSDIETNDEDE